MKKPWAVILIVVLALVSVAAVWLTFRYDDTVRDAVVASQGKGWKKTDGYRFYTTVRVVGDWPPLMLVGLVGFLTAWRMRNREWMRILAAAMIASTLAGILANSLRLTTGRTRPRESPKIEQAFYGPWHDGHLTIGDSRFNAFPSGHTATAFGFAGPILYAAPVVGAGALILAGVVGWASIVVGAHHPSDVAVSIILALVLSWFVWRWMQKHGEFLGREVRNQIRKKLRR